MRRLESDTVLDRVFATDTNPVLPLPVIFQLCVDKTVRCLLISNLGPPCTLAKAQRYAMLQR